MVGKTVFDGKSKQQLIEEMVSRCKESGFKYESRLTDSPYFSVFLPDARGSREVTAVDKNILTLAQIDFENYAFVEGYEAICSYKHGFIESCIKTVVVSSNFVLSLLLRRPYQEVVKDESASHTIQLKDDDGKSIIISIGKPRDPILRFYRNFILAEDSGITIKISGLKINNNLEAKNILEKLANSWFFTIRAIAGVPMMLETVQTLSETIWPVDLETGKKNSVILPKYEYDFEPLQLYWYAVSAYSK